VKADFCIVGAGPAGLALTLMLGRSGTRVVLAERSRSLDREYRGEILQPGGQAVLDQLGVLSGALARGACEMDGFVLVERDRTLLDIDYRTLPGPHNHLLAIPQVHVLEELLAQCRALPNVTYLPGHRATGLLTDGGTVTGVRLEGADGTRTVDARCVIGADGRYSKIRTLAGVHYQRESIKLDVIWHKLSEDDRLRGLRTVGIYRSAEGPVVVHPTFPHAIQLGWILPHGSFAQLRSRGVEVLRAALAEAVPPYAEAIRAEAADIHQFRLLDAFAGIADQWAQDGLVLIGDAAHTLSPLGAQGINVALQDAAVLHPVLVESLSGGPTIDHLGSYVRQRRPAIEAVMKVQGIQAKAMLASRGPAAWLRPKIASLLSHTPLGAKVTRLIAFGPADVAVRTDLFTIPTPTAV
jgi:6-methylpretetramide 4-monooxygenase